MEVLACGMVWHHQDGFQWARSSRCIFLAEAPQLEYYRGKSAVWGGANLQRMCLPACGVNVLEVEILARSGADPLGTTPSCEHPYLYTCRCLPHRVGGVAFHGPGTGDARRWRYRACARNSQGHRGLVCQRGRHPAEHRIRLQLPLVSVDFQPEVQVDGGSALNRARLLCVCFPGVGAARLDLHHYLRG